AKAKTIDTTGAAERERVLATLRQRAPKLRALGITRVSLFGSSARGNVGPKSDVDLLVELDPESHFSLFELLDLQEDLQELLGRPAHFAFSSKLRPWLRDEILAEAIPIY
ncbi:MAG: nucleotidyltransferase family protein, partial [Geminicoccales bacterium]